MSESSKRHSKFLSLIFILKIVEQQGFNIGIYFLKLSVILTIAIMIRIIEISLLCNSWTTFVTLISDVKLKRKQILELLLLHWEPAFCTVTSYLSIWSIFRLQLYIIKVHRIITISTSQVLASLHTPTGFLKLVLNMMCLCNFTHTRIARSISQM